jgi:hypothetical protein
MFEIQSGNYQKGIDNSTVLAISAKRSREFLIKGNNLAF